VQKLFSAVGHTQCTVSTSMRERFVSAVLPSAVGWLPRGFGLTTGPICQPYRRGSTAYLDSTVHKVSWLQANTCVCVHSQPGSQQTSARAQVLVAHKNFIALRSCSLITALHRQARGVTSQSNLTWRQCCQQPIIRLVSVLTVHLQ
jgi:hypothetical protein